ncbi:hypothetical protein M758_4G216900 [Ceratodon purpureus]|uniref:Uncharacterized protein n=1 Tax=Ceratodon purpureus TaxID=3225 RepID=A0A8T0IEQ2_CERPU|nr:hypothetical protein KC19_4G213200 [Ceratodon purpureus]KAG0620452.1 hypothetical protein M758_4G216900 [Ceratodon purpureus]
MPPLSLLLSLCFQVFSQRAPETNTISQCPNPTTIPCTPKTNHTWLLVSWETSLLFSSFVKCI